MCYVDSGGPGIEQECQDHVRRSGELTPGHVYVSKSGRLPCQKVIHAVGPTWQGGGNKEEKKLYSAIYESMLAAEKLRLSSIALPAVSCGSSQYPLHKAAKTIVTAVRDFLQDKQHKFVKKVSLVDQSKDIVREFSSSLGVMFGRQVVTHSRGKDSSYKTG